MEELNHEDFHRPLTLDLCQKWLESQIFRFRPKDYGVKHPKWPGMVGIEVEMLPFSKGAKKVLPLKGKGSSSEILLSGLPPGWSPQYIDNNAENGVLSIDLDQSDRITFEPGGQIEFSSKPYPCLSDAIRRVKLVQEQMESIFEKKGAILLQTGINPWQTVEEIGLQMNKERYRAMDEYFTSLGPYGARMMRQTCTIQINLDFGSNELTLAKRYLAANLLAPYATAIFANSPFHEGKPSEYLSYRGYIWQGLDASRTGFPDLSEIARDLSFNSCVSAYLNFLLDAKVVFVEGAGYQVQNGKISFRDWLKTPIAGIAPTLKDLDTHLSLHFPEVRPRGFLELRSVDCCPRYFQELPAIFYTALLYDDQNLDTCLELLLPDLENLSHNLKNSVYGLKDNGTYKVVKELVKLMVEGFERLPPCFHGEGSLQKLHRFIELFPSKRKTPAEDLLPLLASGKGTDDIKRLKEQWSL